MADLIFPKGIMAFKPHEKAPDFVKGSVVINLKAFKEWVNGDGKEHLTDYKGEPQLKLQITQSKDGTKYNISVDKFVPKKQDNSEPEHTASNNASAADDDLPF